MMAANGPARERVMKGESYKTVAKELGIINTDALDILRTAVGAGSDATSLWLR